MKAYRVGVKDDKRFREQISVRIEQSAEVKERLATCSGNLRHIDIDGVIYRAELFFSDNCKDIKRDEYYVFYEDKLEYWFELSGVKHERYFKKEYELKLTHICKGDEALLVL